MIVQSNADRILVAALSASLFLTPHLVAAGGFGTNGTAIHATINTYTNSNAAQVVQMDGKIVAIAETSDGDLALARYNTDGTLDSAFGNGGTVRTDLGSTSDRASAIALQADGKMVVGGTTNTGTNYFDLALIRYNTNGSLDSSFGSGGITKLTIGRGADRINAVAIATDGRILAAGSSQGPTGTGYGKFILARFNSNGSVDSSFASTGYTITSIGAYTDEAHAIAVQADGKILTSGVSYNGTTYDLVMVRHLTTGGRDTTFGTSGMAKALTSLSNVSIGRCTMALQTTKILMSGPTKDGSYSKYSVFRYSANGIIDTTFGYSGKTTTSFGYYDAYPSSLAVQSDGKFLQSGWTKDGANYWFNAGVARCQAGGTLDSSFGSYGTKILDVTSSNDSATSVGLQADGKIVGAGVGGSRLMVFRLTANGQLDNPALYPQPPTVSFTSPTNGGTLQPSGAITVAAASTRGISTVDVYLDGNLLRTFTSTPYTVNAPANLAAGSHTLMARATDPFGLYTTAQIGVTTPVPPSIQFTNPNYLAFLSPYERIDVTVQAAAGVRQVNYYLDGSLMGSSTTAPYHIFTPAMVPAGNHTLVAELTDNNGSVATTSLAAIVDVTWPTVAITSPAAGSTVQGTGFQQLITIQCTASDEHMARVEVSVWDGFHYWSGSVFTPPYTVSWPAKDFDAASCTITAKAYDGAGNQTSTNIQVNLIH